MRIYRLLLYLYPASFRADYGEEMSRLASTGFQLAQSDFAPLQWLMYRQPRGGKRNGARS